MCYKRDEVTNNADLSNDNNAPSFKYKANIIGNTKANLTKIVKKLSCTTNIFE